MRTTGTTAQTREEDTLLHDQRLAQFRVQRLNTKTGSSGCRYIDQGRKCRWGCEIDWILCHAFVRGECHAGSGTDCKKGYHMCRRDKLEQQDLRTRPIATSKCTYGECPSTRKRKRRLEADKPVFDSQAWESMPMGKKDSGKGERAIRLAKNPVKIKSSWSTSLDDGMEIEINIRGTSSKSVMTRPTPCLRGRAACTYQGNAGRDQFTNHWWVEKSLERRSEEETSEDRWWYTRNRGRKSEQDHRTSPGATASSDQTLLDELLEISQDTWGKTSAFTIAAQKLSLRNDRRQELSARRAVHQCLGRVLSEQSMKNLPVRLEDRINCGLFHEVLTRVQAEHLHKFAARRAVDRE